MGEIAFGFLISEIIRIPNARSLKEEKTKEAFRQSRACQTLHLQQSLEGGKMLYLDAYKLPFIWNLYDTNSSVFQ